MTVLDKPKMDGRILGTYLSNGKPSNLTLIFIYFLKFISQKWLCKLQMSELCPHTPLRKSTLEPHSATPQKGVSKFCQQSLSSGPANLVQQGVTGMAIWSLGSWHLMGPYIMVKISDRNPPLKMPQSVILPALRTNSIRVLILFEKLSRLGEGRNRQKQVGSREQTGLLMILFQCFTKCYEQHRIQYQTQETVVLQNFLTPTKISSAQLSWSGYYIVVQYPQSSVTNK